MNGALARLGSMTAEVETPARGLAGIVAGIASKAGRQEWSRAMHDLALALLTIGGLRLMDISWPTKWLPWPFYACETIIAGVILVNFPK